MKLISELNDLKKLKMTNGEIDKISLKFMLWFGWLTDTDHDL